MKVICNNKKASHDYFILQTFEAGLVLNGCEIKQIRNQKVTINDAFIKVTPNNEVIIINMHITKYDKMHTIVKMDETRTRKLLLNKKEIRKIISEQKNDNLTIVPLRLYLKNGFAKMEIGLAKGKKNYDKRQTLKERDQKREVSKMLKHR